MVPLQPLFAQVQIDDQPPAEPQALQQGPGHVFDLKKARTDLGTIADRLKIYIQKIRTKIENLPKLSNNDKNQLLSIIDRQLAALSQIKTKITTAQNRDSLKISADKIHQLISDLKQKVKNQLSYYLQKLQK